MDSSTSVPDSFRDSYLRRNFYPTNIIERTISTYPRALSEYERRLREASDALCERKLSEVDVIFRDLQVELHNGGFKELDKRKVRSPESLREWLGVQTIHCEDDQEQTTVSVTKQDPRCRFIYIYAQNARSRLKISREMLVEILTFHQVMPDYLDHLLIFGSQFDQRDLDFTLLAVIGPVGNGSHDRMYTAKDVRNLLVWEERLNTAVTVLTSNIEIMNSLSNFYVRLKEFTESGPASRCQEDIDVFIKDLSNIINTFRLQVNRANALIKTLKDRTEMVRQHRSERLNQYMKNEAMLVRIVTIVTLVYLPATFTSTFFSTDIIKYQGQDSPGGNFSPVAMNRWLEVTVPLTFLTLLLAYAGKRGAEMESPPHWASRLRKTQWHQTTPVTPQSTDNLEAYGGSKNPVHAVASVSPV
ncbi:hypothetical protein FJTKL_14134 [Diaporthe vaccinii]|uniref:CorA-like transporter domain-containing protein n=1 Tax=Diaporthe vaccinii TaxID=105482 RepID=A0ABR4E8P5_9PEZI